MRWTSAVVLVAALSSSLVVLPTVTPPAAAARPVAPDVETLPLQGIDRRGLAGSPVPEEDPGDPLAVTGEVQTAGFSAVGVTWAQDGAVELAVQVRTRAGSTWSDWIELEVQASAASDAEAGEGGPARSGSDPLYVGPSDAVQVRVDAGRVEPRDLRLVLIDPGTSPADRSAATAPRPLGRAAAHAAEPAPAYVSRAGWGADESLRTCTPSTSATIRGGILHTTATGNDYTPEQSAAIMRSMYAYHVKSLGWCDLGYNFLVDQYGTLFEGRYGGIDAAVIGAHTGGFNTATFGVSMIGNHDLVMPSEAMLDTVRRVFAWKLGQYGLDPRATTTLTSAGGSATFHPAGTLVTVPVISGHRDYSRKSCPGEFAYPLLPSLRTAVADRIYASLGLAPPPMSSLPTVPVAPAEPYLPPVIEPVPPPPPAPAPAVLEPVAPPVTATTMVSLRTSPSWLPHGGTTRITGRVVTDAGTPVAHRPVQIWSRPRGTSRWGLLSTRTTDAAGWFSGTHRAASSLDYSVRFAGDGAFGAAERTGRVDVAPVVRAALSTRAVRSGARLTLTGTVTPAHAGQRVQRQQYVRGRWVTLATATLGPRGTYRFPIITAGKGRKTYRVVKPADTDHAVGVSRTVVLTVR